MDIGLIIKNFRTEKGWSQEEFCRRTGLKREYLSRVENGHTVPALPTLVKIAAALNVSVTHLLDLPESKTYSADSPSPSHGKVAQPQATYETLSEETIREIEQAMDKMCSACKQQIRAILRRQKV